MPKERAFTMSAVLLVILCTSTVIISDVYRWVDEDGVVHYGNKPPPKSESTQISSHTSSERAQVEADASQHILVEIDKAFDAGDFGKALSLLTPLAEGGHPRAQNGMGVLFDNGLGVSRDLSKAAEWYRLSAEQGYAKAQFNLAVMYAKGEGVTRDLKQAASWYRLAAEQGHAFAQHNLAQMYLAGRGVPKDFETAFKLETSAAKSGDPNAQYSLGLMYFDGEIAPADSAIAYEWISKSLSNGYPFFINLPAGWTVGHHAYDPQKGSILEFVRPGESVRDWNELITIQRMPTSWGRATPQATLEDLKSIREETCAGATSWKIIDSSDRNVTFEWQAYPCGGWRHQHEIAKIIYRDDARFFIHYVVKQYSMPDQKRSDWIERLSSAK